MRNDETLLEQVWIGSKRENDEGRGVVRYHNSLSQGALDEQNCDVQRAGDVAHDDVGGPGGPRERVVGMVGGVRGVWCRHIATMETEEGECRGWFGVCGLE